MVKAGCPQREQEALEPAEGHQGELGAARVGGPRAIGYRVKWWLCEKARWGVVGGRIEVACEETCEAQWPWRGIVTVSESVHWICRMNESDVSWKRDFPSNRSRKKNAVPIWGWASFPSSPSDFSSSLVAVEAVGRRVSLLGGSLFCLLPPY